MEKQNWHNLDKEEILRVLNSRLQGLTVQEAKARLSECGPNVLKEPKKISALALFLEQFKSFLILILLLATAISVIIGEVVEGLIILSIVIMAAVLGFIQNFRAEKALQALKKMVAPLARVIRDGKEQEILAQELVPGDIILVNAGARLNADCRLLEAMSLKVDEAVLTGESVPVEKTAEAISQDVPLSERHNMLYTGTSVVYGRGKAIVVATGMQTEFGKIAASLEEIKEEKTPLQVSVDNLGKSLGILTLSICLLVGVLGILRGYPILKMFIWAVALAVAAVPEALPAVITICLALGTRRMVKRNALVRRLSSVETLGSTSIICSDKTGTLTKGEMSVRKIFLNNTEIEVTGVGYEPRGEFIFQNSNLSSGGQDLDLLLKIGALCNDSQLTNEDGKWRILGDPTEAALMVAAYKRSLLKEDLNNEYPRIDEIPFSSERKIMTTIHRHQNHILVFSKGAGEVILEKSRLDYEMKQKLLNQLHNMAGEGLRTLAFAYKETPLNLPKEEIERDLEFVGLVGMIDPPRQEVKEAIRICEQAGIKSIMITGDHLLTAKAVAKEIGILDKGLALTGDELDKLTDSELREKIKDIEVIARVSPLHKLRLVEAFQRNTDIVAMTGDGVNDSPALKKADIGVAMGITGTEVSKEASDLILLDDNFATIVNAVEEGRNIFKNTKNFFTYGLSCHIGEVLIMLVAILVGLPLPLVATQILWMNLITDGLPPLALSVEPITPEIMQQPPRGRKEGFFTKRVVFFGIGIGALIAIQGIALLLYGLKTSLVKAQTLVFCLITISEMFNAFNWRSDKVSLFKLGLFSNKPLILAVASTILLQILVVYMPFLQKPFHTTALNFIDWSLVILLGSTTFIFMEVIKLIENKRKNRRSTP
ncbi:MAG: Ca2+-transporting ATPase [Ignavibacteria bacterium]|nr:MAG: Ca2+-transporting ATPase [Ignavibacteria bacterium]